jgi:DNA polymerase III epsilon subunit family exonuclease
MMVWHELRYTVIDLEGNGQRPPDVVELAAVPIVGGLIGEPMVWLCKPDRPITPIARRIHGITNEMVDSSPAFADLATEIRARLSDSVLVAHNAAVDVGVLKRKLSDFEPSEVLDTLKLSRSLLPEASHRLGALASLLHLTAGIPLGLQPHRATYDAMVTARLFVRLATREDGTPKNYDELRHSPRSGRDVLF